MHTLLIVDDEEIERAGMAQFIRDHGRLWKINDITSTAPLWRRRSQSGAVFNEGEMKGISGYRFSSNCSAVTVALPSAAKVMPSADWGV